MEDSKRAEGNVSYQGCLGRGHEGRNRQPPESHCWAEPTNVQQLGPSNGVMKCEGRNVD